MGVRNALIENFHPLHLRNDAGVLWENFLVVERQKHNSYSYKYANSYFWRTYTNAKLDYLEESEGKLNGFEFKFKKEKAKAPKSWIDTYPTATYQLINQTNFLPFIDPNSGSDPT